VVRRWNREAGWSWQNAGGGCCSLKVSDADRVELERMARSSVMPHRQVRQARGLLLAADGVVNEVIARELGTTPDTVRR